MKSNPNVFYSCGEDGFCFLYDLRDNIAHSTDLDPPIRRSCLEYQDEFRMSCPIYSLDLHPLDSHQLAVGGETYSAKVYDTRKFSSSSDHLITPIAEYYHGHHELERHDENNYCGISGLQYHSNGTELLVSQNSDHIYRYDLRQHNRRARVSARGARGGDDSKDDHTDYLTVYKGHLNRKTVKQVTYLSSEGSLHLSHATASKDSQDYVLSGSDLGHIFIWNRNTGEIVKILIGSKCNAINCITPHKDLPLIATCGIERTVKLWYPNGEKGWLGGGQIVRQRVNEKDRIESEIEREKEVREVEQDYVTMLMDRSAHQSHSSSEFSSDDGSSDNEEIPFPSLDREAVINEERNNHVVSVSEVNPRRRRRRSYSEMEGTHSEWISGEGEENEEEPNEEYKALEERQNKLRLFISRCYGKLQELDRAACQREGIPEDSDSDIYYDQSQDDDDDDQEDGVGLDSDELEQNES
jgi:DDB1- and CUL4-associated factor 8